MDLLSAYPVCKSKAQKQAVRNTVQSYLCKLGYICTVEENDNLLAGLPETAKYFITAGYDTSAVITLLEIARTFPENQRYKVCFVLFASAKAYRKAHRAAADNQLVLHLDGFYAGKQIRMLPTETLKKDRKRLTSLYKACGYFGKRSILVEEERYFDLFSIHRQFPYAVKICTTEEKRSGNRIPKIPDQTNINILRAALTTFICCDAVQ